ncbi:MAG TPA: biopolymer transporter ExbD [Candidatus Cloacimonadota bacterium]|nr:biopolymer transporter ExbD [Candidatus Cloacimonadota bacterium]
MKIGRKRKGKTEIPTSSMSDIAFLLIIFFMATTKFDVKEGIKLVLPQATEEQEGSQTLTLTEKEMTRFQIVPDGTVAVNKDNPRRFDAATLDALIKTKLRENPQMIFKVITDRDARYEHMIFVVDRLKAQKAEKISLSTN